MTKSKSISSVEKIYTSSNECLENYKNIYNFDNSRVLSVVGSGDQYFTCLLNGAKEVELFDINKAAWDYFRLRFYATKILSYEEYLIFFVLKKSSPYFYNGQIKDIYEKILKYIPEDLKCFLHKYIEIYHKKNEVAFVISESESIFDRNGNIITMPHFSKEEYYKLQSLLCKTKLPNFTWANLLDLPSQVDGSYDLMLFSNIYDYLGMDAFEYKEFLKQFKASVIQAHYSYQWNSKVEELCNSGFYAHTFLSTQMDNQYTTNCVISLKKTK